MPGRDVPRVSALERTHGAAEGCTAAVRQFYEENPYPPPIAGLDGERERWRSASRRRAAYHLYWPAAAFREDFSILVAGCGTSQAAKYAVRWPKANVTGIDVSRSSIEHTGELQRRYRLDNLTLVELAVERAGALERRFDLIVCTGVLHHLAEPDAGLRALRDVLAPSGALHLMVYAPYGRAGVYLLQEYCRQLGIGTSPAEIRELVAALHALPDRHPLAPLLRSAPDFASEAGVADALLHPRDRPYSVPQLFDLAARNGLRFGRWLRQAPYLPGCGAPARTPHRRALEALPAPKCYAALELYRGNMLRHNAILHGDERDSPQPVRFDDEAWLHYVPIRQPDTVCVEERLPAGAAGVLINRGHTDTDLYLPINARQRRWLRGIDGVRRAGALLEEGSDEPSRLRAFLEQLWQHDQIVIDASRRSPLGDPEDAATRRSAGH